MLERLGVHIGDDIEVIGQDGTWDAPGPETTTRMQIVGTGLAPMTTALGHGAVITLSGLQRLNSSAREQAWFIRLPPGADKQIAVDTFAALFPGEVRKDISSFEFEEVGDYGLNLQQIGSVPMLFAVIMALVAAAVLVHVLTVAARARRRDLAVLRVLGFSRGQVLRTIAWQSMIYAAGALAVGIPAGVALGRLTWREYAASLGVVPEPVVSWTALLIVVGVAIALAAATAVVLAFRVVRTRPAAALRAE